MNLREFLLDRIADARAVAASTRPDRWGADPARVLAEYDATRRVVESGPGEQTLRLLAAPYSDHPDWRNEWNAENCPTPR